MNDRELWNHMAAHYQSTLHTRDESSYPDDLVAFLAKKGAAASWTSAAAWANTPSALPGGAAACICWISRMKC